MNIKSAEDLFSNELRGIYSAEKQLTRVLPRFAKQVSAESVRAKLQERLAQGEVLLGSIEQAFDEMEMSKGRKKNPAIEGLIDDAEELAEAIENESILDSAIVGAVQKIEHYCIASWGTAAALARLLGQQTAVAALEQALEEGKNFDQSLTELAEEEVNPTLLEGADEDPEEEVEREAVGDSGREKAGRRSSGSGRGGALKAREYRDEKGNVHHHTKRYMEQHGKGGRSAKRD